MDDAPLPSGQKWEPPRLPVAPPYFEHEVEVLVHVPFEFACRHIMPTGRPATNRLSGVVEHRVAVDPFHLLSKADIPGPGRKRQHSEVWTSITGGATWEQVSIGWLEGRAIAQNAISFSISPEGQGCRYRVHVREWKLDKLGKTARRREASASQQSYDRAFQNASARIEASFAEDPSRRLS